MRSKKKWLWLAAVTVVSLAIFFGWLFYQPKYEGRPISHWLNELNSTNQTVSIPALYALLEMGPEAVPYLQREAASNGPEKNPRLRQTATSICQRLPASLRDSILRRLGYLRPGSRGISPVTVLGLMEEDARPAVPVLLEVLRSPDPTLRAEAAGALLRIASNDKAVLQPLFENYNSEQQRWPYFNMGNVIQDVSAKSPQLMPFLLEAYPKSEPYVRFKILCALAAVKPLPDQTREFLHTVLRENPMDATGAAIGLVDAGEVTDELINALLQAVEGRKIQGVLPPQPIEKHVAAQKIAELGSQAKQAAGAMRELLDSKELSLQTSAINFLVNCGEARSNLPPMIAGKTSQSTGSFVQAVSLVPFVEEIHPEDRNESQSIANLLTSSEPIARLYALKALEHLGAKEMVERMEASLQDEQRENRLAAMKAIIKLQPDNARLHLKMKRILTEGGYLMRLETVKLIQTRPEFVEKYRSELQALTKEKGERLRKAAEGALGQSKL